MLAPGSELGLSHQSSFTARCKIPPRPPKPLFVVSGFAFINSRVQVARPPFGCGSRAVASSSHKRHQSRQDFFEVSGLPG
jgi:hypothetical protein